MRNVLGRANMRNNFITSAHIPGTINVEANVESRSSETRTVGEIK